MRKARLAPVAVAVLLVGALALGGCGAKTTTEGGRFAGSVTSESIAAVAGQDFQVVLDSNPSTGYEWAMVNTPDAKVIQPKGNYFLQGPGSANMPGAPGRQVWNFAALAPGKTDVKFENRQAGQQGGTPAQTHDVAVAVVAAPQEKAEMKTFTASPISAKAGQDFFISLSSQAASTGHAWKLGSGYDEKVVAFRGAAFAKPQSTLPGAPTEQLWRFGAVGKGTTEISFGLVPVWEKSPKVSETKTFKVTVN